MFEHFDFAASVRQSPVMIIILACSVVTLAFVIERLAYFAKRKGNANALLQGALGKLRAGDVTGAARMCSANPHPLGPVAAVVLEHLHLHPDVLEEKLQIALSEQRLLLERNLGVLGTMGNTAPLIGLLGTVWGIMRAFNDMARSGAAGPSVVAAGVAEALFTTAAGLLVAVPAVLLFNHFTRRIAVMLTVAENHTRTLRLAIESVRPVVAGAHSSVAAGPARPVDPGASVHAVQPASAETVRSR
jgi:biopolymer transport protein ExbB